jgi:hypothetical protein
MERCVAAVQSVVTPPLVADAQPGPHREPDQDRRALQGLEPSQLERFDATGTRDEIGQSDLAPDVVRQKLVGRLKSVLANRLKEGLGRVVGMGCPGRADAENQPACQEDSGGQGFFGAAPGPWP